MNNTTDCNPLDLVVKKVLQNSNSTIFFCDLDGTLFAPNLNILKTPFLNRISWKILTENNIPLIIITGRAGWKKIDQNFLKVIGIPKPDMILTDLGYGLYTTNEKGGIVKDDNWTEALYAEKMPFIGADIFSMDKNILLEQIKKVLLEPQYKILENDVNPCVLRVQINTCPLRQVLEKQSELQELFSGKAGVYISESRYKRNDGEFFSGYFHVVPLNSGKDVVVKKVIAKIAEKVKDPLEIYCFGDGMIDVPMLKLNLETEPVHFHSFLVSPTYLAEHAIKNAQVSNQNINLSHEDGPTVILAQLRKISSRSPPENHIHPHKNTDKNSYQTTLSAAQNNSARSFIKPWETVLNTLVDSSLTPNQISLLGLGYILESQRLIQDNPTLGMKLRAVYLWIKGMSMDVLDGIRARKMNISDPSGQLVDVFSDRGKEFVQLFYRGMKTHKRDEVAGATVFLAAISCILPSLSRAEAESKGFVVEELDSRGGSMLSRTKILFKSFVFSTYGNKTASFKLDKELYKKNVTTFYARKHNDSSIKVSNDDVLKKKAELRMRFLLKLLLEEHAVIVDYLRQHSQKGLVVYEKSVTVFLNEYSNTEIKAELAQEFDNLHLSITQIINNTF